MKEYAAYKGDQLVAVGTAKELAIKLGIKQKSIYWYTSPTYQRRLDKRENSKNARVIVCLDEKEGDEQ